MEGRSRDGNVGANREEDGKEKVGAITFAFVSDLITVIWNLFFEFFTGY